MSLSTVLTPGDVSRAVDRASAAAARAHRLTGWSQDLVRRSRQVRLPLAADAIRYFALRGVVDDLPVRAWWSRQSLRASPSLLRRAELIVAMGERFVVEEGARVVSADLGRPTSALVTLIRACDRVGAVSVGPLPGPVPRQRHRRPWS